MAAKVVHFEILGKDASKLHDFYGKLFDWKINADNPMNYGLIEAAGDGSIGGGIGSVEDGAPGHVTFYVEVDNIENYLSEVESMGGRAFLSRPDAAADAAIAGCFY